MIYSQKLEALTYIIATRCMFVTIHTTIFTIWTSFEAPAKRNSRVYPHIPYNFLETRVIGLQFDNVGLSLFKVVQLAPILQMMIFSAPDCVLAVQGRSRSAKIDDFGTNRKRVYDFLLIGQCDYGHILQLFWDTATYWLKISLFSYPSHSAPPLPVFPLEFHGEVNREKTRVTGLSSSEDRMIVAGVVLTQCQRVTDGETDGRNLS